MPLTCGLTVTVAKGVTVPNALSVTWISVGWALATPTGTGCRFASLLNPESDLPLGQNTQMSRTAMSAAPRMSTERLRKKPVRVDAPPGSAEPIVNWVFLSGAFISSSVRRNIADFRLMGTEIERSARPGCACLAKSDELDLSKVSQ